MSIFTDFTALVALGLKVQEERMAKVDKTTVLLLKLGVAQSYENVEKVC